MPSLKVHMEMSKKRTGKDFRDLHKWMDEDQEHLGVNHRIMRHDLLWLDAVKEKFGSKYKTNELVLEFIYHIIKDYEATYEAFELRRFD